MRKNNSKNRSGKKNNNPVNDRYEDLLYEPTDAQNAAPANKGAANNNNKSNSSKGGKKGKKK